MKTLRCLIVDDEPLARQLISTYVAKTPFLENVGECETAKEAAQLLDKEHPDLAFLDIHMPGMTGMELARVIPKETRVIFITAYDHYAIEGFKVNALDYLLKPVSYVEFLESATRALNTFNKAEVAPKAEVKAEVPTHIIVKSDYKLVQIALSDILFIEGVKDYVKIHLKDNPDSPVMSLMNLKTLEQKLPSSIFMRVHRSFIVNRDNIRVIERGTRIVFGKHMIPVGDTYKATFTEFLNNRTITVD